ncbi:MAG: hypothetical protein ACTJHC_03935 [Vagococcus sp.]
MEELTGKLKDQLLNYRDIIKQNEKIDDLKTNANVFKEKKVKTNKLNTRKWQSKLY